MVKKLLRPLKRVIVVGPIIIMLLPHLCFYWCYWAVKGQLLNADDVIFNTAVKLKKWSEQ